LFKKKTMKRKADQMEPQAPEAAEAETHKKAKKTTTWLSDEAKSRVELWQAHKEHEITEVNIPEALKWFLLSATPLPEALNEIVLSYAILPDGTVLSKHMGLERVLLTVVRLCDYFAYSSTKATNGGKWAYLCSRQQRQKYSRMPPYKELSTEFMLNDSADQFSYDVKRRQTSPWMFYQPKALQAVVVHHPLNKDEPVVRKQVVTVPHPESATLSELFELAGLTAALFKNDGIITMLFDDGESRETSTRNISEKSAKEDRLERHLKYDPYDPCDLEGNLSRPILLV
jgi:hypothetical protein